tara:strand:- start:453 stop:2438 length:1986 start_codon:yes stop_codon:yes gene_type:complete
MQNGMQRGLQSQMGGGNKMLGGGQLNGGGGQMRPVSGAAMPFSAQGGGGRMAGSGYGNASGYGPGSSALGPSMHMGGYAPLGDYNQMPQDYNMNMDYGGMGQSGEAGLGMGRGGWGGESSGLPNYLGGGSMMSSGMPGGGRMPGIMPHGMLGDSDSGAPSGQPSRAIFVNQLPPETTYEELCDAVGAFGSLESIKIIKDKRQAFVNFVDAQDAYQLMVNTGQQILLRGKPVLIHWGKTRPVAREMMQAIRNGATRNLYVSNVPDTVSEVHVASIFSPFGEVESVRLVPKKRAAFINFASVTAAMRARETMHGKLLPAAHDGPPMDAFAKQMLINFTSAQQNCMRARGGRGAPGGWGQGGYDRYDQQRGWSPRMSGGYGGHRSNFQSRRPSASSANSAVPTKSRALYFGSLPDSAGLKELAEVVEPLGVIESLRIVRPKSCGFVNFHDERVAHALLARFTASEEAAPMVGEKKLTVNFAKARPCSAQQLKRITDGARRKILVRFPKAKTSEEVLEVLGHKTELLVHHEMLGTTPAEPAADGAADTEAEAPSGEECTVRLEFCSVSAAIAAKFSLEAIEGDHAVLGVEFLVEPTSITEEELSAIKLPADGAAEAPSAEDGQAEAGGDGEETGTDEAAATITEATEAPEAAPEADDADADKAAE